MLNNVNVPLSRPPPPLAPCPGNEGIFGRIIIHTLSWWTDYRINRGWLWPESGISFLNRESSIWFIWFEGKLEGQSTFSQTHKVDNNGNNGNFVFPYICSFLRYLDLKMLVNVKLDNIGRRDYLSRLQTLLVFLFLNGTAKTKFAISSFLYRGEMVKNCISVFPK